MDDVLRERGVDGVDFIKIDVEGAEDAVLEGMRDGLGAGRYRRVLVELHPALLAERGLTPDGCCEICRASGYAGFAFDHSAEGVRRAAYATSIDTADLLQRNEHVPASDPWPHMLWTRPDTSPL